MNYVKYIPILLLLFITYWQITPQAVEGSCVKDSNAPIISNCQSISSGTYFKILTEKATKEFKFESDQVTIGAYTTNFNLKDFYEVQYDFKESSKTKTLFRISTAYGISCNTTSVAGSPLTQMGGIFALGGYNLTPSQCQQLGGTSTPYSDENGEGSYCANPTLARSFPTFKTWCGTGTCENCDWQKWTKRTEAVSCTKTEQGLDMYRRPITVTTKYVASCVPTHDIMVRPLTVYLGKYWKQNFWVGGNYVNATYDSFVTEDMKKTPQFTGSWGIDNGLVLLSPENDDGKNVQVQVYLISASNIAQPYASTFAGWKKVFQQIANAMAKDTGKTYTINETVKSADTNTVYKPGSVIAIYDDTPDMGGYFDVNGILAQTREVAHPSGTGGFKLKKVSKQKL